MLNFRGPTSKGARGKAKGGKDRRGGKGIKWKGQAGALLLRNGDGRGNGGQRRKGKGGREWRGLPRVGLHPHVPNPEKYRAVHV